MATYQEEDRSLWGNFCFSGGPSLIFRNTLIPLQEKLEKFTSLRNDSEDFQKYLKETKDTIRYLYSIPDDYDVYFCQGGATFFFQILPANFRDQKSKESILSYSKSGYFSTKAIDEAHSYGKVEISYEKLKDENGLLYIPDPKDWKISENSHYIHIVTNESVEGIELKQWPALQVPVIADMSSNFMAKTIDWSKVDCAYAHAQKNIGIAGSTIIIIKKALVKHFDNLPYVLQFQNLEKEIAPLPIIGNYFTFKYLATQGKAEYWENIATKKSSMLYKLIDSSNGFYFNNVKLEQRSNTCVTFFLKNNQLEQKLNEDARKEGLIDIKGHRAQGGFRVCLYLPIPFIAVEKLLEFLERFRQINSQ